MSNTTNKFSAEVRARALQMVLDCESEDASLWAAATSIAGKIGCSTHGLMNWTPPETVWCCRAGCDSVWLRWQRARRDVRRSARVLGR